MEIPNSTTTKLAQSSRVLILVAGSNDDSLAAGLALHNFLLKLEKEAMVVTAQPKLPKLQFLAGFEEVRNELKLIKNFVIDVATTKTSLDELSYKKETDRLSIVLKPKGGQFSPQDISFRSLGFPFDLVVTIGIDSLESLGELYNQNAELFFEVPLLNIGFRTTNQNFGQFNLVNLQATSNAEIVFDLLNRVENSFIDEGIATQLLTGIISETESFQHVRTTPQTFLKASQLVGLGANQQEIIGHLYKTKSLGMLKLWGRVLARLNQVAELGLVYSAVNQTDIARSAATTEDVGAIIREMTIQLSFAKVFAFIKEDNAHSTTAYLSTALPLDLGGAFAAFHPASLNPTTIRVTLPQPLAAAESQILSQLHAIIPAS